MEWKRHQSCFSPTSPARRWMQKETCEPQQNKRLTSAVNWKAFVIVTRLSAWPVNFTAKVVSNLQSKLHAKNLKKTRRDSNDSTMHYPTDFPIYVQIVDALVDAVDSQPERGLNIERNKFEHARTNQSHAIPSENQQVPQTTSIGNNSTSGTRVRKCRKTRHSRKSTSYAKRKAPIRWDTSTVINLSNVDLTEDEVLLLSRGLTFCSTPRHIDWAQIKADINDFSRRLRIKEFFYDNNNCDLEPNPFWLMSTWCPSANHEPVNNNNNKSLYSSIVR